MVSPSLCNIDYGSSIRIRSELRALASAQIQVSLCSYSKGNSMGSQGYEIPFLPSFIKPGPTSHRMYLDPQLACVAMNAAMRARPHIIHAHHNEGPLVSALPRKAFRVPLIMDLQGSISSELEFSGIFGRIRRIYNAFGYLEHLSQNLADHIIVSSPLLKKIVRRFTSDRSITVIADCVDASYFYPRQKDTRLMNRLGIPMDRMVVVYLGSLAKVQGVDLLLRAIQIAIRSNNGLHFVVMGFPCEEYYRSQSRKLGIADHVTSTGRVPYSEAPMYLSIGDLAISPKRCSSESNGKILNYMAMGIPTVLFDNENNRFLAGDSSIYAEDETPESLAEAIGQAATDKEFRLRAIGIGIERARFHFSPSKMKENLVSVYKQYW